MAEKLMTDDAVIKMLQEEAKNASRNSASQGLGAYLPKRPTTQAPKPNTRFLRNILRETDSHNQALLAKEAEEAHARLRTLKRSHGRRDRDEERDNRRSRREAEDEEELYRAKRRRVDVIDHDKNRLSPPKESKRYQSRRDESPRRSRSRSMRRRRRRRHYDDSDTEDDHEYRKRRSIRERRRHRDDYSSEGEDYSRSSHRRRSKRHPHHRSRSILSDESDSDNYDRRRRSPRSRRRRKRYDAEEEPRRRNGDRRKRRRSYSRSSSINSSDDQYKTRLSRRGRRYSTSSESDRSRSRLRYRTQTRSDKSSKISNAPKAFNSPASAPRVMTNGTNHESNPGTDSDPLEEIVGPLPPPPPPKVKVRGRGTVSSAAMGSRFSVNYDPSADVTLDVDDEDDWGQALEAQQARAKFKQNQGDRLRAAGFTEEEIKLWEKDGEKNEEDVKWSKLGEGREWDRGKVVNDEGAVQLESDFGMLKGT